MPCCKPLDHAAAARFFSWYARRSVRQYRKNGLGALRRRLADAVREADIEGATLLDIGCGAGFVHQSLLRDGAARAVGIDLSEDMLAEARALAAEQSLTARTDYVAADFVYVADALPVADVTILDRVVCCYPDAETLVNRSLEKTGRVYALTYPRDHLWNRILTELEALGLRMLCCAFRSYIHDTARIQAWIEAGGFAKRSEHVDRIWIMQVYSRR